MSSDRHYYVGATEDDTDKNHSKARCCVGDQGLNDRHGPERNTDAAHYLDGTDRKWGTARHAGDASPRARVWGPCSHGSLTRRGVGGLRVEGEILAIGLRADDNRVSVLHFSGQDRNG